MDDQTSQQSNSQKVPLNQETIDAVLKATDTPKEEAPKPPMLDPYILFTQIEGLRKEGVDEATIREAFNQFMTDRQFGPRVKVKNSQKRSADSVPMPTQEDINKMYTDRLIEQSQPSEQMQEIIDALEQSKETRSNVVQASRRPTLKMLTYRFLYFTLTKFLAVIVFIFNKLGVK